MVNTKQINDYANTRQVNDNENTRQVKLMITGTPDK